jgi:hypothetical protein
MESSGIVRLELIDERGKLDFEFLLFVSNYESYTLGNSLQYFQMHRVGIETS